MGGHFQNNSESNGEQLSFVVEVELLQKCSGLGVTVALVLLLLSMFYAHT